MARYCKVMDADVELKSTPAAALSEQEVLKLRWLSSQLEFIDCGECGSHLVVDVTRQQGRCHKCGSGWEVTLQTSTTRQASSRLLSPGCVAHGSAPRDPTGDSRPVGSTMMAAQTGL